MPVANLGISMLITLDLHALNNEGAEGNQLMTRQVQIVDDQGRVHAVNAISGDMIKHGFVSRLQQLAIELIHQELGAQQERPPGAALVVS